MTTDHTPPAARSPYPQHSAPHPQRDEALAHLPPVLSHSTPAVPPIGALGATLIGGAVAVAIGALLTPLFWRSKAKADPAKSPAVKRAPAKKPPVDKPAAAKRTAPRRAPRRTTD